MARKRQSASSSELCLWMAPTHCPLLLPHQGGQSCLWAPVRPIRSQLRALVAPSLWPDYSLSWRALCREPDVAQREGTWAEMAASNHPPFSGRSSLRSICREDHKWGEEKREEARRILLRTPLSLCSVACFEWGEWVVVVCSWVFMTLRESRHRWDHRRKARPRSCESNCPLITHQTPRNHPFLAGDSGLSARAEWCLLSTTWSVCVLAPLWSVAIIITHHRAPGWSSQQQNSFSVHQPWDSTSFQARLQLSTVLFPFAVVELAQLCSSRGSSLGRMETKRRHNIQNRFALYW